MPRLDRTGPAGLGPRTGRGFGSCCGRSGYGGRMFFSRKEEGELLLEEKELLEKELKAVQERIKELEDQK